MEPVVLREKKDLDIYINPQRQRLLRLMTVEGHPMTPKQLSDEMGISPSSVQHHLNRLAELGLVAVDHTENVRGITAHYYIAVPRVVSVGCVQQDENTPQRLALIQSGVNRVFQGVIDYYHTLKPEELGKPDMGDVLWGIARLRPEEAEQLFSIIHRFLQKHEGTAKDGDPWEYALIAYPVKEEPHA